MKRLLLVLACVALPATAAWANPALVVGQHTICSNVSASSLTCTFAGAVTAGNMVVVACAAGNSVAFTFSDSVDGSYTTDTQNTASSLSVAIGHKENHSGSSPTITCATGATSGMQMFIAEFSGVATSTPNDGTPTNQLNLATTTPSTGSITTANANSLVIGYLDIGGNPSTIAAGAGFTIIDKDEAAAIIGGAWEYQVAAAGTVNPSFTLGTSETTWAAVAAFKSGGGVVSGCKGLMLGVWSCF